MIGILGGGISGLALAVELGARCEVLEKSNRCAGLCETVAEDGFLFDATGPHILFSKDKETLAYIVEVLGENVHQKKRQNRIWFKDRYVKYPFENGLHVLDKQDLYECLLGYLKNPHEGPPQNLAEWAYCIFGEGIADKYLLPYNHKIWKWDPKLTSLDWAARIPRPPMEDVLKSAIGIETEGYLHQLHFYYPKRGGIEALVKAFADRCQERVQLGFEVAEVAKEGQLWRVTSKAGDVRRYATLVSTLPSHELAKIWPDRPQDLDAALGRLRYNGLANVLLGWRGSRDDTTAIYVPDPDVIFHRVSFPGSFSEHCVPPGHAALVAEVTAAPDSELWARSDDAIREDVLAGVEKLGLLRREDLVYQKVIRYPYGYPISDLDYATNVAEMREIVAGTGLHLLGRFAEFDYINADVCIARARVLGQRLGGQGAP